MREDLYHRKGCKSEKDSGSAYMGDSFFKGTLILTAAGIVVKVTGALNWFFLSRVLGGEGIGLYQLAFPIYFMALSISSAGVPVAISIITAEKLAANDFRGANRVFRLSLTVLTATGIVTSLLLYFGADWLITERIVRDARAYYSLVALAPAIFFVTVLSSFRGYFQGWQMMTPTAVSQIVEQLLRVITMLIFANMLLPQGLELAAAGASFGACPGAAFGLLVLLYYYWRLHGDFKRRMADQAVNIVQESKLSIIGRIAKLAIPVSLSSIMLPIVANLDLLIVPYRLEAAGFSVEQATELFGYLTGMAVPLVNMSTILTASLATSLVPAIAEAASQGNRQGVYWRAAGAMRLSNLITVPAFVILWLLASQVSQIFYAAPQAGRPISVLSIGIILLGVHQVTTGVLQGLGYTAIPVINMVVSAIVKVAINWTLTAIPALGIVGASWATVADFGVAAILNMYFVRRYTGFSLNLIESAKFLIAGACMAGVVLVVYDIAAPFNSALATVLAAAAGSLAYGVVLLLMGGLIERDVARIPLAGPWLARVLRRIGLFKNN